MKRKNLQAYAFLSPFLVLVSLLYILPAILTVIMAFTSLDSSFVWSFNGIENFKRLFKDPRTLTIVWNTIKYVVICVVITVILDLFLAVMTTHFIKNERVSEIFKAVLMIPMITPGVVYAVMWIWMLDASEKGLLNQMMAAITGGRAQNWIANYPFLVVCVATLFTGLSYGTIIFSSAIKSIPENQFKAARVDGASELSVVLNIIIPNLRYHINFVTLWETLGMLTSYTTILLITNGGPGIQSEVWGLSAYHKAFIDRQYGYGAAISLVLIVVTMLLMLAVTRAHRKQEQGGNIK